MDNPDVKPAIPRPPFWMRMSVAAGNFLQLTGLIAGSWVMWLAAHLNTSTLLRVILMILGWLIIYICCHSLGHWVVGRLAGIRFTGYGLRGTDHPEEFGTAMRNVMSRVPMFTAITEKASMEKASPVAKALMFGAGETSTSVCVILAGLYAWRSNSPGGLILLIASILMSVSALLSTSTMPKGDYAKARRALRRRT
jgi:hypothetical protein